MTYEISDDTAVENYFVQQSTPNDKKDEQPDSNPAMAQRDDALPEERAETHSEGTNDEPEILEDDELEGIEEESAQEPNDAEETEQEDSDAETFYEVPQPDGGTRKMTAAEFTSSFVPKVEFTRKTQEIADQRKSFEAEAEAVRQQQNQVLEGLMNIYQSQANPLVAMQQKLREAIEDGDDHLVTKLRLDMHDEQKRQDQIANAFAYEKAKDETKMKKDDADYLLEQQRALKERMPILGKPEGARKFQDTVMKAMKKAGFTDEDMAAIKRPDHRNAILAYYAGKYLASMESKPQIAATLKGKAVSPKTGVRKTGSGNKSDAAMAKFVERPTEDSLENYFTATSMRG